MISKDEDGDFARMLEMIDDKLRALVAAQGLEWDTEVAKLNLFYEDAPIEQLEKTLFGASLDDIVNFSEFTDREIRLIDSIR
jgi:hypothetical protein